MTIAERLLTAQQVENQPVPEFLIGDFLVRDTLAQLFGGWKVGKTFVAIDWTLHICTGRSWLGHQVKKPEPVLYVATEGARAFGLRMRAWRQHHGVEEPPDNLVVHPRAVNLAEPNEIEELMVITDNLKPALVVFDTQSRCTPGIDENASQDQSQIVHNLDAIRNVAGSCMLLLHHPGRQDKSHGRGSSAIDAALDTVLKLDGVPSKPELVLKSEFHRDFAPAEDVLLLREQIFVDVDGQQQDTCIITERANTLRIADSSKPTGIYLPESLATLEQALYDTYVTGGLSMKSVMVEVDWSRTYADKQLKKLESMNLVRLSKDKGEVRIWSTRKEKEL